MSKKFTSEDIRKIADLARLELTSEEEQRFASQLENILGYIEKLNEVKTAGVEPLTSALETPLPLREDEPRPKENSFTAEQMLTPAPEQVYENFKVPQVIGGAT